MTMDLRADYSLASLRHWAATLRLRAAVWDSPDLDPVERQSLRLEWDNVVDRVDPLAELAREGVLHPAALAELRGIAEELTELLPTMQRLRLRVPDLDALKRAAERPAGTPIS